MIMGMAIPEHTSFLCTAFLKALIYHLYTELQGNSVSCEWFHKAGMQPIYRKRGKLTKNTSHYVQMINKKRDKHTLQCIYSR